MNIDPLLLLFLLFVLGPIVSRLLRGPPRQPPQRPQDSQRPQTPQESRPSGRRTFEEELSRRLEEARRRVQEAVDAEGERGASGSEGAEPPPLVSSAEATTLFGERPTGDTLRGGQAKVTVRGGQAKTTVRGDQTKTTVRGGQAKTTVRGAQSGHSVRTAGTKLGSMRRDQPAPTVNQASRRSADTSGYRFEREPAEEGVAAGELGSGASLRRARARGGSARFGLRVNRDAALQGFIWHEILSEPLAKRKRRRLVSPPQ